jgi:hypothetical protein
MVWCLCELAYEGDEVASLLRAHPQHFRVILPNRKAFNVI